MIIPGDDPVSKGAQRFEVFTGAGRRRDWPPEVKASIVAECLRISEVLDTRFAKSRTSVSLSPGQLAQIGQECLVEFQAAMISAFSPWVKRDGTRVLRMLSPSRAMR